VLSTCKVFVSTVKSDVTEKSPAAEATVIAPVFEIVASPDGVTLALSFDELPTSISPLLNLLLKLQVNLNQMNQMLRFLYRHYLLGQL